MSRLDDLDAFVDDSPDTACDEDVQCAFARARRGEATEADWRLLAWALELTDSPDTPLPTEH